MRAAADAQRVADESLKLAERTAARAERHAAKAEKRAEREAEIAAKELERVAKEAERVAKKAERAGIIQRMAVRTERIKAEEAVAHAAMLEEDRLTAEIDALHMFLFRNAVRMEEIQSQQRQLPGLLDLEVTANAEVAAEKAAAGEVTAEKELAEATRSSLAQRHAHDSPTRSNRPICRRARQGWTRWKPCP